MQQALRAAVTGVARNLGNTDAQPDCCRPLPGHAHRGSMKPSNDGGGREEVPSEPVSSDRLWLEVVILAGGDGDGAAREASFGRADEGAGEARRTILVAVRDTELRGYIRDCLHDVPFRVLGPADLLGSSGQTAVPDLIIAEDGGAALATPPSWQRVPRILVLDDAPPPGRPERDTGELPVAVLVKPFNARRLRAEVSRCLDGPASGPIETPVG